jgi:hypothetical protein
MPESLAEVLYELGRAALEQQERQVAELRARTQAVLAGAALIASFFGATAIDRSGLNGPAVAALTVLGITVSACVYVLLPHRMQFVVDVRDLHRELYDAAGEDSASSKRVSHIRFWTSERRTSRRSTASFRRSRRARHFSCFKCSSGAGHSR